MRAAGVCCVVLLTLLGAGGAAAQAPPAGTAPGAATTENPRLSRQLDRQRMAAKKARRTECERQAREQKLHLTKRLQFVRTCMAGS